MLESTNDYLSLLAIILALFGIVAFIFHIISIRITAKNLKEEADYYKQEEKES